MITITEATAKVCMQALGELPLKFTLTAFSELSAAMQVAAAVPLAPVKTETEAPPRSLPT